MRTKLTHIGDHELAELFSDIEQYLDVIEAFRMEGFEPCYAEDEWLWRLYGDVLTARDVRHDL